MKKIVYVLVFCLSSVLTFGQQKSIGVYAVGFYNLENLFDTIHDDGKNDSPKTFSSIVRFEQCQDDGRDEADGLQIGHEVEKSDE